MKNTISQKNIYSILKNIANEMNYKLEIMGRCIEDSDEEKILF